MCSCRKKAKKKKDDVSWAGDSIPWLNGYLYPVGTTTTTETVRDWVRLDPFHTI